MQVNYNVEKDMFSVVNLTAPEAGALAGTIDFAIAEKKKQNMYVVTCKKGMLKIVESISNQLHAANFLNSLIVEKDSYDEENKNENGDKQIL